VRDRQTDRQTERQTERVIDLVSTVDLRCNPEDGVAVINDVTRNNIDTDSIAGRLDVRIDKVRHTPTTHLCHLSQSHRSTHVTILTLTVLPTESMSGLTRSVTPQSLISTTCHNYTYIALKAEKVLQVCLKRITNYASVMYLLPLQFFLISQ